jgi:hypothetical protein
MRPRRDAAARPPLPASTRYRTQELPLNPHIHRGWTTGLESCAGPSLGLQDSRAQCRKTQPMPSSHQGCTHEAGVCSRLGSLKWESCMIRLHSGLVDTLEKPARLSEHPCPRRPAATSQSRSRGIVAIRGHKNGAYNHHHEGGLAHIDSGSLDLRKTAVR